MQKPAVDVKGLDAEIIHVGKSKMTQHLGGDWIFRLLMLCSNISHLNAEESALLNEILHSLKREAVKPHSVRLKVAHLAGKMATPSPEITAKRHKIVKTI